jgi:hypothetical protein
MRVALSPDLELTKSDQSCFHISISCWVDKIPAGTVNTGTGASVRNSLSRRSEKCYNCVTPRGLIGMLGQNRSDKMIIRLTNAERDTILAALRRWQSYPAAREADSIATNGGKHRALDNADIERICKRITKTEKKRDAAPLLRQSNNGARERKSV